MVGRRKGKAEPYPEVLHDGSGVYHLIHPSQPVFDPQDQMESSIGDGCLYPPSKLVLRPQFVLPLEGTFTLEDEYWSSSESRSVSPERLLTAEELNRDLMPVGRRLVSTRRYYTDSSSSSDDEYQPMTKLLQRLGLATRSQAVRTLLNVFRRIQKAFDKNMFAISGDHLLCIIHYNVFRGLVENVRALGITPICMAESQPKQLMKNADRVPADLRPTQLQSTVRHPAWIDILPEARLRDNLIRRMGTFDDNDLSDDLIGEVFKHPALTSDVETDSELPTLPPDVQEWLGQKQKLLVDQDPLTCQRRGLIVWKEPWDVQSWEITPGFLQKWGWAVVGCDEMLRATNRWRAERGEESLCVEVCDWDV
jgi:hypothetical protein